MNFTPEQQKEFARFPPALRALIEAELAVGNSIVEVGHSHPAPPAGAYFKLANKVSTRLRSSGGGIEFRERNSSLSSGEFTDAKRFYFIVEPPAPPPPEPDMDAIREALGQKPAPLVQQSSASTRTGGKTPQGAPASSRGNTPAKWRARGSTTCEKMLTATTAATSTETPTGRTHLLHFCDPRPPEEVRGALERDLATRFTATMEADKLRCQAAADFNGLTYQLVLRFLAALAGEHRYSLHTEVSWPDEHPAVLTHYRRVSSGWIEMWTRELAPADPPSSDLGAPELYRTLCQSVLQAKAPRNSVARLQQGIIELLKRGGRFATSHKEGGTNICWQIDRFVRSDYGDYPDLKEYTDEPEFLRALWQFCHWEVSRRAGKKQLSEFDVWKLILRSMLPK